MNMNTYSEGFGFETNKQLEDSQYVKSLINKYRKENIFLKKYIQIINTEIRKHLKLDSLPSLEEGFATISKKMLTNSPEQIDQETIDEWLHKLFNTEYIDPLSNLYEIYIKNLRNEIDYKNDLLRKNKNDIVNLVNENNDLRDQLQIEKEEMKNIYEVKINSDNDGDNNGIVVMDREYVMKVEERNRELSRENEILITNYNKLQNEMFSLKLNSNYAFIEDRNNKMEEINNMYLKCKDENNNLIQQLEISKQKLYELAEKNRNFEVQIDNLQHELKSLKETNQRYESIIKKNDDL